MCSLEGTLMLKGSDGVERVPLFAEVYVDARTLGSDPPARHLMTQHDTQFDPRAMVVQVGDTVDFVNIDKKPHEVHASLHVNLFNVQKENSREFTYSKLFLEVGISDIGCQIHANMSAVILTVPNSFHAHVDSRGMWRISGLPRNEVEVGFWVPGGKIVKRRLTPCVSPPVQVSLPTPEVRKANPYIGFQ
jgi:plastocyanin